MKAGHLFEHFSIIKDPRQSWKIEHKLFDILLLTICAVIAGADGWEAGQKHESPHGIRL